MQNFRMLDFYNYFSTAEFAEANYYEENDLGAVWTKEGTGFRVWAPTADQVILNLYKAGSEGEAYQSIPMRKDIKGTWTVMVEGDLDGIFYTYSVTVDGRTQDAVDPYAKAVGVNGRRGMVVNLADTNPEGYYELPRPELLQPTDSIIYELHVRDFSIDHSSGMTNKGKYLAFTEKGATNSFGDATGVDHLKELGITHVHLLPVFDYMTVDETRLDTPQFNWGYDPLNYNAPEGSYSTDPYNGKTRIKEFKQMVHSLHQEGIRVIMDVVYNHTMQGEDSNFNKIVPGYYYRLTKEGHFSNGSGCGNETASERAMMRKFMIDSVLYWAREYRIDGFRFDLMGLHDILTMNEIRLALDSVDPSILIYGEGWTGGLTPLPDWERALKVNLNKLSTHIAVFSDNIRDGVKGDVFSAHEKGFISGKSGMEETIKFGVVAATEHPGVDYWRVNYSNSPWALEPTQTINYCSAHDNLTLWDKLKLSCPGIPREQRVRMNLLAAAIIFTCQGIPFLQAGEEFLRSKPLNNEGTEFDENSYCSPDAVNSLKWDDKTANKIVFKYYQGLIAFRKANPVFRLTKAEEIRERLTFLPWTEPNVVSYLLHSREGEEVCVIYNGNPEAKTIHIPEGQWKVYVMGRHAGTEVLEVREGGAVNVEPISALIMKK